MPSAPGPWQLGTLREEVLPSLICADVASSAGAADALAVLVIAA